MNHAEKIIKPKLGLLQLSKELRNISKACRVMGYSRDTFYRYKELVENGGIENLIEKSRRKPNLKNRVELEIEAKVRELSIKTPCWGRERIADQLLEFGIQISPSTVKNIWTRLGLNDHKKRLKALEEESLKVGYILTEEQKIALEKKKYIDQAITGEIETLHPGYLGSQDTFYIGYLKGVGRIYQQTFVDTYSKVAICKLYQTKNANTAADLLNDRVLPFFKQYDARLIRILTDRGSEYCGKEDHPYQLFLNICEIDHSRTKAYHPQTNGICERFHRTILDEFYRIAFRTKIYRSVEQLQTDLDLWLENYNHHRNHKGKMCCGRKPMQTFIDDLKDWRQKEQEIGIN